MAGQQGGVSQASASNVGAVKIKAADARAFGFSRPGRIDHGFFNGAGIDGPYPDLSFRQAFDNGSLERSKPLARLKIAIAAKGSHR